MSEQSKPASKTKATPKSTDSASKSEASTTSDSSSTTTGKSDAGKSSRDSVGGAGAVHYGFFSNVKTPEYKSGWDDIWGKKSEPKKKAAAKTTTRKTTRQKDPVVISLSLADLPDDLQKGLAAAARAKLKKSRINYDNRAKAGAVTWRIECEVTR